MSEAKKMDFTVEVKKLETQNVAYVRNIGPYAGDGELFGRLFGKLLGWAGPQGLMGPESQAFSVYYDDPKTTDPAKLKLDVCLTVPEGTKTSDGIDTMRVGGGLYALLKFEISPEEYGDAWTAVYSQWLPESGYVPEDRPCFEYYLNNPAEHPEHKHIVNICVPVRKA